MAKKLVDEEKSALAASTNRLQVLERIAEIEEKIAKKREEGVDYDIELVKALEKEEKILSKIDKYTQKISGGLKEQLDTYSELGTSIGNLSSLQDGIKNTLKDSVKFGIEFSDSIGQIQAPNKAGFMEINRLMGDISIATSELAQLNEDDAAGRLLKTSQIESMQTQMLQTMGGMAQKMGEMNDIERSILENSIKQKDALFEATDQASKFSRISKDTKEIYEELGSDLDGLQKTFKKFALTAEIFFSSFSNLAGMSLIYVGGLVDDFNELAKGVGGTVTQMFQLKAQSFAVSKLLGEEAGSAVTSLAEKLGDANDVTLKLSLGVGALTGRLGVSGEEAATLVNQFGNLSGKSSEVAMNTMEATSQLASANGVAPAGVMKDIAQNTEFFALYAKDGGANIGQAAIQARKLGVDLGTASKISDNLLDYQSSVQSEMQASVLLGRNLNLNKARELAYAGDAAGAMKEALNAAGGIDAYNKMDVYQRRAVAEAIGVGASELQQMVANQEKAETSVGKLEGKFDAVSATVREMAAGIAGTAVKGIGGMLIGIKDFKSQVSQAKEGLDFIKDSAKGIGSLLTGDKGAGLTDALDSAQTKSMKSLGKPPVELPELPSAPTQTSVAGPLTKSGKPDMRFASNKSIAPKMDTSNLDKTTKSVGGINATDLIKGAAALLIMAAALFVVAKALQEFNTVEPESLLKAGAALVGLGTAMFVLGTIFSNPLLAEGLAVATVGILGFGAALALAGVGAKLFGEGFSLVSASLPSIVEQLSALSQVSFLPIFGLATALTTLGASLALVAVSGLAALPVLAGIGLAAGAVGMMMGGGEGGESKDDALLTEIQGLRADIKAQPIIVQLDGRQVYINNLRQQKNKSN
jgi:hypothetical protein